MDVLNFSRRPRRQFKPVHDFEPLDEPTPIRSKRKAMNETDFIQGALSYIALFLLSEGMTLDRNIVIEQRCFAFNYVIGSLFRSFLLSQKILAILINSSKWISNFSGNWSWFSLETVWLSWIRWYSYFKRENLCQGRIVRFGMNWNLWYSLLKRILYFFYFEDFLIIKLSNSQHSMIFDDTLTNALQEFQISSRR